MVQSLHHALIHVRDESWERGNSCWVERFLGVRPVWDQSRCGQASN